MFMNTIGSKPSCLPVAFDIRDIYSSFGKLAQYVKLEIPAIYVEQLAYREKQTKIYQRLTKLETQPMMTYVDQMTYGQEQTKFQQQLNKLETKPMQMDQDNGANTLPMQPIDG